MPGEPKQPSIFPGSIFKGLILKDAHAHILQTIDLSDSLQKVLPKNGTLLVCCFLGFFFNKQKVKTASKK